MADVLRIRRRVTGLAGAPGSLANAELAYNEVDHVLYYGEGTGGGGGTASVIVGVGGNGLGASSGTLPLPNATPALYGTNTTWSRSDHVHLTDSTRAPTASPTFTGTITINGTITGTGLTGSFAAPGPIGSTTPSTGAFTTLTASGATTLAALTSTGITASPISGSTGSFTTLAASSTVSGAGFTALFAAPPPIGSTTASTGAFTTLSATGAVSGAGFNAYLASPPAIGGTAAAAGSFTTLSITGLVSGSGINNLFASPPPIGGTVAASGAFTALSASSTVSGAGFTNLFATPPAMGGTTANSGAFTSLTASGTVSGAGFTALLLPYAPLASPVFTGAPSLPTGAVGITQANGTNNTTLATTAFVRQTRLDQFTAPTAAVSLNSQQIINLGAPTNNTDAATKLYVDQNSQGLSSKGAVVCATTANITLSGLFAIDGYTPIAGDRVLVKDQTLAQNNGIWLASATAWTTRATDMDTWAEVPQAYVFVSNGTVNSSSAWVCNSPIGGTLGTTPITWVQFSQQAQVSAGAGLVRVGNTFDVIGTAGRINVLADSIDIDTSYIGQSSITTLGTIATGTWAATTITVARGGTGAVTLTGYLKGNGTSAFTSNATIPNTDVTGLGTMSTQNASAVAITGGTIDGITFDMGTF